MRGRRNDRIEEIVPPGKEQVSHRHETRWIPRRCALLSVIVRHEGKEHNARVTTAHITEEVRVVRAVAAVIVAVVFPEVVVVLGVAVAGAKEFMGDS